MLTSVQDLGRRGYLRYGVPQAGALDTPAMRIANILVGNREGAAGLELTVLGPKLRFLSDTMIALTGADLGAKLDDAPVPAWQSVSAPVGSVLDFGGADDGLRAWLAFAGGIDVPIVMGSRSTYAQGGFGGFEGRALKAGDVLRTFSSALPPSSDGHGLPDDLLPAVIGHDHEVRVVLGPQESAFSSNGMTAFLTSRYTIGHQSDRMGHRLEGQKIEHEAGADIVSDATMLGSVQVPGDGQPIVLLADRGTTGGYAKIATVISPDISILAQAAPGDTVGFSAVSVGESRDILAEQEALIADVKRSVGLDKSGLFHLVTGGEAQQVVFDSGDRITGRGNDSETGSVEVQTLSTSGQGHEFEFEIEVRHTE
jgi:antagonist of KipI